MKKLIDYMAKAVGAAFVVGLSFRAPCTPGTGNLVVKALRDQVNRGAKPFSAEVHYYQGSFPNRWLLRYVDFSVKIPVPSTGNAVQLESEDHVPLKSVSGTEEVNIHGMRVAERPSAEETLYIGVDVETSYDFTPLKVEITSGFSVSFGRRPASSAYAPLIWPIADVKRATFETKLGSSVEFHQKLRVLAL